MQPISAHNPPPEDVDDGEDGKSNSLTESNESGFGIGALYGMKIGQDGGFNTNSYITHESDPDYINNDYIFEDGNTQYKFLEGLSVYINNP